MEESFTIFQLPEVSISCKTLGTTHSVPLRFRQAVARRVSRAAHITYQLKQSRWIFFRCGCDAVTADSRS